MGEELPEDVYNREISKHLDQSLVVRINRGEKTEELTLPALNHLFADIDRYNEQFSLGAMMYRTVLSLGRFEDENEGKTPNSLGQEEEKQQMSASVLGAIHQSTLDKIGLSLEPVTGKKATLVGLGKKAGEGEMRLNVANRENLTSFLSALSPNQVESAGLKPNLESLSGVLALQVFDNYNLSEPSDYMLQLFGGLGKIVEDYERLGMSEAVERLATYLIHTRQGDLGEYVAIERANLMAKPGENFGPADWQRDSSPDLLESRWDEAINILRATKASPKAKGTYHQLQDQLDQCIRIARENMKTIEYYSPEARARLRKILESAHMRLDDLKII